VTRLLTGQSGRSAKFRRQWKEFLRLVGERLLAGDVRRDR
jgi:hypothetical protein